MIRTIIELYVKKTRNPNFSFDKGISSLVIFRFVVLKGFQVLRGLKLKCTSNTKGIVYIGRGVNVVNSQCVNFGRGVTLGEYVYVFSMQKKGVQLGDNVSVGAWSRIVSSSNLGDSVGSVVIGDYVGIGEFSYINGAGNTVIGRDTIIGQYFSVHPENHNYGDPDALIRIQGVSRKGVSIGENCWIGSKVTILDGVEIGNGCVIAAGAVVTKSFEENSIIAGVPAKFVKLRC